MRFSVIIQSYLGDYPGAATNREAKLIRSVDSVLSQSLKDFELIIVADGCDKTFDIISEHYKDNDKVQCYLITKQPMWSGYARNFGITKAKGDYIVYLDGDDYFGKDHLKKISSQLAENTWVYFNDTLNTHKGLVERNCMIKQKFQSGTSNICHKRLINVKWAGGQYGYDDYSVVQSLLKFPDYKKIETPEYICCHIPRKLDV